MTDKDPIHLEEFRVAIDSGAHTWYKTHFQDHGGLRNIMDRYKDADFSMVEGDEFQEYLHSYIDFLKIHKDDYEFHVTLDVIGSPEKSWEITEYMEEQGLTPMPVFHFGEDYKWLERMVEKYDYIGVGGLGQDITKEVFYPFADKAFEIICDGGKTPKVKVHGFAVASVDVITRYPWYTCDASTWTALSRNGTIYIPKPVYKNREIVGWDYLRSPMSLPTTARRTSHKNHVNHKSPMIRHVLETYFTQHGYTFDCISDYDARDTMNIRYFKQLEKACKKVAAEKFDYGQGANILLAGTPSGASTNLHKFINLLGGLDEPKTSWLGSFYYKRHNKNLLDISIAVKAGRDLRSIQTEIEQTRAARKKKRKEKEEGIAKRRAAREAKEVVKKKIERVPLPVFPNLVAEPGTAEEKWLDDLNHDSLPENRPVFQEGSTPGTAHHSVTKETPKGIAVWYSICSMHLIHDTECNMCQAGSWHYYDDPKKEEEKVEVTPVKGFFDLGKDDE